MEPIGEVDVARACRMILDQVDVYHLTLEEATRKLRRDAPPGVGAVFDEALAELRAQQSRNMAIPRAIANRATRAPWYMGPTVGAEWSRYRQRWEEAGKPGLDYLEESTTRIVGLLANPRESGDRSKGLVMGSVQSGKTGNFAGVIAKAADAGYQVVIVLSGVHNNLRRQTQQRLDKDIFDLDRWEHLTTADADVVPRNIRAALYSNTKICAVVKKNSKRLRNLVEILRGVPIATRRRCAVLIIDDEADQATPNSAAGRDEVSAINQLMRDLWREIPTGSYVAYTATPFANLLMNPDETEELFPSDFITSLEPGASYFGAEKVFGLSEADPDDGLAADGLDMVRDVPQADADALKPPSNRGQRADFDPELPPSLLDALSWFVVATAVRRARGDEGHSSMLIHTTHYTQPHFTMRGRVEEWLDRARGGSDAFETSWRTEQDRVNGTRPMPSWPEVAQRIPEVLDACKVIVDNGTSDERLDYSRGGPQTVIAIGGGTLSRGLTLEDLVVSYFVRTTSAYDTLMQMGRWFGYRDGYEELPRVWMTPALARDFAFLARVEQDLRAEISSFEGSEFTPEQVGVRIRLHPGRLEITDANRMTHARLVRIGLSGTMLQTFLLDGTDREAIRKNFELVKNLLGPDPEAAPWGEHRLWRSAIPSTEISDFLEGFYAHPDLKSLQSEQRLKLISQWLSETAGEVSWNAVVVGNSEGLAGSLRTVRIANRTLTMVQRAPLRDSTQDKLNFKAIMSPGDWVADIDPQVLDSRPTSLRERKRARRVHAHRRGLLVIYPISGKSGVDENRSTRRRPIPEDVDLIGFSIIFPTVDDEQGTEGSFVSVRDGVGFTEDYEELGDEAEVPDDPEEDE